MKKTFFALSLIVIGSVSAFAGPHGCPGGGGGCRPCRPCRPCHPCRPGWHRPCPGYYRPGCWGWGGRCSRDLANAAAITSIVANGIGIVRDLTYPTTVVSPAPVYTAPVVTTPAPVYTAPVVVPQPTYVAPAPVVVQPGASLTPGLVYPGVPAVQYIGY